MKDIRALADNLMALRKQYRAVLEVGEFLDEVASLDQVREEILRATEQAKQAKQQATLDAEQAVAHLASLTAQQASLAAECEAVKVDAEAGAQAIIDQAETSAQSITAAATEKRKAVELHIAQLKDELFNVSSAVEGKRAELASVEKQVADLRAVASNIAKSFNV